MDWTHLQGIAVELIRALAAVAVAWITARRRSDSPDAGCSNKERRRPHHGRHRRQLR